MTIINPLTRKTWTRLAQFTPAKLDTFLAYQPLSMGFLRVGLREHQQTMDFTTRTKGG
jgi:hypothetical protein